ncbi:MAG: GTPase [Planctomycetota bacterium]
MTNSTPSVAAEPIAALATPAGAGVGAVVRVSGTGSIACLSRLLHGVEALPAATPKRFDARLELAGVSTPLPLLVVVFPGGASYTGEESAELYLSGSEPVVDRLLETLRTLGFRSAEPGEFTRRAFLNGRLDLTRAEAVARVIEASDLAAARAAHRVLAGELAREIMTVGDRIHDLVALLEAGLDFSEQEVEPPAPEWIAERVEAIIRAIDRLGAATDVESSQARVRIAIWGRANAGKSTLLNRWLGRDTSITSEVPGTTRDPVSAVEERRGWPTVEWIDLPGERSDPGPAEAQAMVVGHELLADADQVLYLVDARRGAEDLAGEWSALPEFARRKAWWVVTQRDRRPEGATANWAPESVPAVVVSSTEPGGLAPLEEALDRHLRTGRWSERSDAVAMTRRQVGRLAEARDALVELRAALCGGLVAAPELVVIDLRDAHAKLEEITGGITTEGTLDKIFSQFCLGK